MPSRQIYSVRVLRFSLVRDVKHFLLAFESAVVVQESRLVERLGSVEAVSVGGA